MGRILMYVSSGCTHCVHVKVFLEQNNIPFSIVNLTDYPERRKEMIELTGGKKSVPQIFFNEEYIGGADKFFELEEAGLLRAKIKETLAAPTPSFPSGEAEVETKTSSTFPPDVETLHMIFEAMKEPKTQLPLKKVILRFKRYKRVFKGRDVLNWLKLQFKQTDTQALDTAKKLLQYALIEPIQQHHDKDFNDKVIYRYTGEANKYILNTYMKWPTTPRSGNIVAAELQKTVLFLADNFISPSGRGVDYEKLKESNEFKEYRKRVLELQDVDLSVMDLPSKKAFFINLYNALVIHANVVIGPPTSAIQRAVFFSRVSYRIGSMVFSLSGIEHGVLRANRKPPGIFSRNPFSKGDPRLEHSVPSDKFDARIHFALVCGAKSCPAVRVYTPQTVEEALQWATESFCQEEVILDVKKKEVQLSMLFKWYYKDFGNTDTEILRWIATTTNNVELLGLLDSKCNIKIKWAPYNWDTNNRGYDEDENVTEETLVEIKKLEIEDSLSSDSTAKAINFEAITEEELTDESSATPTTHGILYSTHSGDESY